MPEAGVGVALFVHYVFCLRDGATLIVLRQRSSSTVQSFCFTFSHRLVGPPAYTPRPWRRSLRTRAQSPAPTRVQTVGRQPPSREHQLAPGDDVLQAGTAFAEGPRGAEGDLRHDQEPDRRQIGTSEPAGRDKSAGSPSSLDQLPGVSLPRRRLRRAPRRAQRQRSYDGLGRPANPSAALRSWPRWLSGTATGLRDRASGGGGAADVEHRREMAIGVIERLQPGDSSQLLNGLAEPVCGARHPLDLVDRVWSVSSGSTGSASRRSRGPACQSSPSGRLCSWRPFPARR